MARTPEGKVKDKVTKILREWGVWYFMPAQNGFGRSGIPDIIGCVSGQFFAIETKAGDNKPTVRQEHEMLAIRHSQGEVLVINEDNIGDVEKMLRRCVKRGERLHGK